MPTPRPAYHDIEQLVSTHLPGLRPAQAAGLALWVFGTILAGSGCQNAVIAAVGAVGGWHALRQRLREWLYDGADKTVPCRTQVDVQACFAPLLRWVLSWWPAPDLALALDATVHTDQLAAVVISVLYRGTAIPVAWAILPANTPGAWLPHILVLVHTLAAVMPADRRVLLLADRGLWSPTLWHALRGHGWHPLVRIQNHATFQPSGQRRKPARDWLAGPGHAWVGAGKAFAAHRVEATLLVVWDTDQAEPWALLTDLAPDQVGVCWYGLRVWIELGFRGLKGCGWQWEHTRRTQPDRAARHWLVLAVATLVLLAYGTRVEDAQVRGTAPARLRMQPTGQPAPRTRRTSLWRQGQSWLRLHLGRRRLWTRLWLRPEAWPEPPPRLVITYYACP